MTSGMGGYAAPSTMSDAASATEQSTIDTAKEQAAGLGQAAKETGGQVASTVAEQAHTVAAETAGRPKT